MTTTRVAVNGYGVIALNTTVELMRDLGRPRCGATKQ